MKKETKNKKIDICPLCYRVHICGKNNHRFGIPAELLVHQNNTLTIGRGLKPK